MQKQNSLQSVKQQNIAHPPSILSATQINSQQFSRSQFINASNGSQLMPSTSSAAQQDQDRVRQMIANRASIFDLGNSAAVFRNRETRKGQDQRDVANRYYERLIQNKNGQLVYKRNITDKNNKSRHPAKKLQAAFGDDHSGAKRFKHFLLTENSSLEQLLSHLQFAIRARQALSFEIQKEVREKKRYDIKSHIRRQVTIKSYDYFSLVHNRQRLIMPTINDLHDTLREANGLPPSELDQDFANFTGGLGASIVGANSNMNNTTIKQSVLSSSSDRSGESKARRQSQQQIHTPGSSLSGSLEPEKSQLLQNDAQAHLRKSYDQSQHSLQRGRRPIRGTLKAIPEEEISVHEDCNQDGDFQEIFNIRESEIISSALFSQIVQENSELDNVAHNISKNMPLKHSRLLLYLSQNFFHSVVLDSEKQNEMEHNLAFVRTFEEFVTTQAFHRAQATVVKQKERVGHAFESQAFLRVVKVLFEGQARRMSALMCLKQTFPSELSNCDFANYLKVTKGMSTNKNTNLINQYVREGISRATSGGTNQDQKNLQQILETQLQREQTNNNYTVHEQHSLWIKASQGNKSSLIQINQDHFSASVNSENLASKSQENLEKDQIKDYFDQEFIEDDAEPAKSCRELVTTVFENLQKCVDRNMIPYSIRAMLRIVSILAVFKNGHDMNQMYDSLRSSNLFSMVVTSDQLPLLASLLTGCWLSTGFRDPSIFGVSAPLPFDMHWYLSYFQSCRIVFENLLSGQLIPNTSTSKSIFGINRLNKFIKDNKKKVLQLFTKLIDVPLPERDSGQSFAINPNSLSVDQKHHLPGSSSFQQQNLQHQSADLDVLLQPEQQDDYHSVSVLIESSSQKNKKRREQRRKKEEQLATAGRDVTFARGLPNVSYDNGVVIEEDNEDDESDHEDDFNEMTFAQSNSEQTELESQMNVISIHRSILFEMMQLLNRATSQTRDRDLRQRMEEINNGFELAYRGQTVNYEDDKLEVFTQVSNLFDLNECIKSVEGQEMSKFKNLMDNCARNRIFASNELTPQFYQVLYESLVWIIGRSCQNLVNKNCAISARDCDDYHSTQQSTKTLQVILGDIVKKNRKDALFQTRAKQVNLALRKLGLDKNNYHQQSGQRILLRKVLDIYHEFCKNHAVALRRSKWQAKYFKNTFRSFDQAFDETYKFLDLIGEAIQVRYLLKQTISRPLCVFYDMEGGVFMSTTCDLQKKVDYRSQFLAQNQEMIYEMGELVKTESKTQARHLELVESHARSQMGYKYAESHERMHDEEMKELLKKRHVKITSLGGFIQAITKQESREFFQGFNQCLSKSIEVDQWIKDYDIPDYEFLEDAAQMYPHGGLTPGYQAASQYQAANQNFNNTTGGGAFITPQGGNLTPGNVWDEAGKDLKHAINFRRTFFFFINFITVLFLRQDVQQFETLGDLIDHDRNCGDNIRNLCHKYLLQQLIMRYKRGEGQLTTQERKCIAVNADRHNLQYDRSRVLANQGTVIKLTKEDLCAMQMFNAQILTLFDMLFNSKSSQMKTQLLNTITEQLRFIIESVRNKENKELSPHQVQHLPSICLHEMTQKDDRYKQFFMHIAIIQLFSAHEQGEFRHDFIDTLIKEMKLVTQKSKGPPAASNQNQ